MKNITKLLLILFLGAFLFQSFQCQSPEMQSAKLSLRDKDYTKAAEMFGKEVKKNPTNAEAWLGLSQCHFYIGEKNGDIQEFKKSEEALLKLNELKLDQKSTINKTKVEYNLWIKTINLGIDNLQKFAKSKSKADFDNSMAAFQIADNVRPKHEATSKYMAMLYGQNKQYDKAIEYNEKHKELMKYTLEFGKNNGLFLKMDRADALKKLGEPMRTIPMKRGDDTAVVDIFKGPVGYYTLSSQTINKGNEFKVSGWRIPQMNWLPDEQFNYTVIDVSPYSSLGIDYYSNKEMDTTKRLNKAIENFKIIVMLDPSNKTANSYLVSILNEAGRGGEADDMLKDLVAKNPKTTEFRVQYGDALFNQKKYDDAIEQYKSALKIDPNFADAARNMASAYKNKAVKVQQEQQKKIDADPKYVPNTDEYFPFLEESNKYFEMAMKDNNYKNDLQVLSELWNNYYALDNQDKAGEYLRKLEAMEYSVPKEQLEMYWMQLTNIYGLMKDDAKFEEATKKYKELLK